MALNGVCITKLAKMFKGGSHALLVKNKKTWAISYQIRRNVKYIDRADDDNILNT